MRQIIPNPQKDWLGVGWAYPVNIDPTTGGIALAAYETDIHQSIRIILGTAQGERVMRPDFGCGIYDLVFEAIDSMLITRIQTAVMDSLVTYEPRIEVLSVDVNTSQTLNGYLKIGLQYRVRLTNQKDNLVYPFYFREGGPSQVEGAADESFGEPRLEIRRTAALTAELFARAKMDARVAAGRPGFRPGRRAVCHSRALQSSGAASRQRAAENVPRLPAVAGRARAGGAGGAGSAGLQSHAGSAELPAAARVGSHSGAGQRLRRPRALRRSRLLSKPKKT